MNQKEIDKLNKENRKSLVYGAKSHIKSLLAGMNKFAKGSKVESQYIAEHADKLQRYYLDKIINYKEVQI